MADAKTKELVERLRDSVAQADADMADAIADAQHTGERPDLDDWHVEVPAQWLREAADILAAPQPAASDVPHDVVRAVHDVLLDTAAALAASISLLERSGKKAAASDKMFDLMLSDYRASLARARSTLHALATPAPSTSTEEAGPVAIYHGNGLTDCGDGGHHNVELLKIIPAGTALYDAQGVARIESNCCIEDSSEPCGPFLSLQEDLSDAEAKIGLLRAALEAFRTAKGSLGADDYDGVDDHARDLLEDADSLALSALSR